tara:strand:+ start:1151 stop:1573 length:423 start_codon:yes stop_codon:yes gene_type:complete
MGAAFCIPECGQPLYLVQSLSTVTRCATIDGLSVATALSTIVGVSQIQGGLHVAFAFMAIALFVLGISLPLIMRISRGTNWKSIQLTKSRLRSNGLTDEEVVLFLQQRQEQQERNAAIQNAARIRAQGAVDAAGVIANRL